MGRRMKKPSMPEVLQHKPHKELHTGQSRRRSRPRTNRHCRWRRSRPPTCWR